MIQKILLIKLNRYCRVYEIHIQEIQSSQQLNNKNNFSLIKYLHNNDIDILFVVPKSLKLLQDWIDKTIVGLNLCPFAKASLSNLHIEKCDFINSEVLASKIIDISELVQKEVYSNAIVYFKDEMRFDELYKASIDFEDVLESIGYQIKVIAFHPAFVFEGLDFDEKANYVNRSPMPLLHLIPQKLIEKAKLDNMSAKNISINNETKIKELDESKLVEFFGYMNTDNK